MKSSILLCLGLVLISCNITIAQGYQIELIKSGNYYFIEAKFEKIATPVIFLFDTGTNGFGITTELNEKLHLKEADSMQFTIGDLEIRTEEFKVWSHLDKNSFLKGLVTKPTSEFIYGGIIGNYPLISNYYAIIDLQKNKLYLNEPLSTKSFNEPGKYQAITDFEWVNHMIFLECSINDTINGYFHFDTGIPTYHFITLKAAKKSGCKLENEVLEKNHLTTIESNSFRIGGFDFGSTLFLGQNMDYNKQPFGAYELNNIIGSLCNHNLEGTIIHLDFVNLKFALEIEQ